MCIEHVLVLLAGVGAALVRVVEQVSVRAAPSERHVERLHRDMAVVHRAEGPADDEPREQVEDDREVQLALRRAQLGGVPNPSLVRPLGREVAREQILSHRLPVVAVGGVLEPPLRPAHQPLLLHQPDDSLAAHLDALLLQRAVDSWAPVLPSALRAPRVCLAHLHTQQLVSLVVCARRPLLPRVEARLRHVERPAQPGNPQLGLLRDEREPHAFSFAKKAAAFLRNSCGGGWFDH
jgi:hypothetical protein